jgi:hypothetical protein
MRNSIVIALVLIAIGIYGWDALLLTKSPGSEQNAGQIGETESISLEKCLATADQVRFVEKGRDPFTPRRPVPKPVSAMKSPASETKTDPAGPKVKISGIMWNKSSPIAMIILPDGSSAIAAPKQSFGDITVKKIEQNRILVGYNKKEYWICQ